MGTQALQDHYPDDLAHCFGCGRLNPHGHHIRTFVEGDETVTRFTPEPHHIAIPGFVYGGLLASLIDCHGTGTAAAAGCKAEERAMGSEPPLRYVTARLMVEYLKPTPLGVALELRGRVVEVGARKVVTRVSVFAEGVECVRGEVLAVRFRG
jgi:acyl-coenzyme A thioesterase PaaI-like protein